MKKIFTTRYQVTKNITIIGILVTGILSAIVGLLAFFGQNMGTFVISMDDDAYATGIVLSETDDFLVSGSRLLVDPLVNSENIQYSDLEIDKVMKNDGNYRDSRGYTYIAYTFYLMNGGNTIVDLVSEINVTEATRNVDEAARIMLIRHGIDRRVYKKHDQWEKNSKDHTPDDILMDFKTDTQVCTFEINNLRPQDVRKFSLLIWLEGWDKDCTNEIMGGQLKLSMVFNVLNARIDKD